MGGKAASATRFSWTPKRERAAEMLFHGCSASETAGRLGIGRRTLERWKTNPLFRARMDERLEAYRAALWAKAHPDHYEWTK
jgi:hypothetical protein